MSFSKRAGLAPARPLQRESMDGRLRNGLWNCIENLLRYIEQMPVNFMHLMRTPGMAAQDCLVQAVWVEFRGAARDMFLMAGHPEQTLRQYFYQLPWNEAYDLIEFIMARAHCAEFEAACNVALEKEGAAYRIVGAQVVELTDDAQLDAIDAALGTAERVPLVREHLRTALARLAARPEPDYRNAMKEAISAVETLVGMIAGSPGVTLDEGLKLIAKRALLPLHPSLVRSWGALYGYTSDAGVRHGMKDGQPAVGLDDAMYLVVSSSAIVSYLIALAGKAGVELG